MLRIPFIKNTGISSGVLLGLFLIKILAGIAIGWISIHIYGPGNDYWDVNDYARDEYQVLITNPGEYFSNLFTSGYQDGYAGIFNSYNSYWNDLRSNIVIKLVSVFNIFSRGDYYINSLFYNFIIFFAHVILFRLFIKIYPGREILIIIGCFLLPSVLYFSSGIHRDGLVFLMLAVLIYSVYISLIKNRLTLKRLLFIFISLFFLFLTRNFVFLALMPALFAWVCSFKTKWPAFPTFIGVYLVTGILFFTINTVSDKIDPPAIIVTKQSEYLQLKPAATQVELTPLQPTFRSFAANAAQALNHSFLRPYLWEMPVKSVLPAGIELFTYQLLFVLVFILKKKDLSPVDKPFMFFSLFFTFTVLLIIGYIVPNLGSLVRYRSLYLPLIITPLLCVVDWKNRVRTIKIKKN